MGCLPEFQQAILQLLLVLLILSKASATISHPVLLHIARFEGGYQFNTKPILFKSNSNKSKPAATKQNGLQ
jgi:hypothetical protein